MKKLALTRRFTAHVISTIWFEVPKEKGNIFDIAMVACIEHDSYEVHISQCDDRASILVERFKNPKPDLTGVVRKVLYLANKWRDLSTI